MCKGRSSIASFAKSYEPTVMIAGKDWSVLFITLRHRLIFTFQQVTIFNVANLVKLQ
jgi:hypothetical protein